MKYAVPEYPCACILTGVIIVISKEEVIPLYDAVIVFIPGELLSKPEYVN